MKLEEAAGLVLHIKVSFMKKRISLIVTILFITTITTAFAVEGLRFSITESKV